APSRGPSRVAATRRRPGLAWPTRQETSPRRRPHPIDRPREQPGRSIAPTRRRLQGRPRPPRLLRRGRRLPDGTRARLILTRKHGNTETRRHGEATLLRISLSLCLFVLLQSRKWSPVEARMPASGPLLPVSLRKEGDDRLVIDWNDGHRSVHTWKY